MKQEAEKLRIQSNDARRLAKDGNFGEKRIQKVYQCKVLSVLSYAM